MDDSKASPLTPLENRRSVSEPSCWMGASSDLVDATASASTMESAIPSSSTTYFSACSKPLSSEGRKAESGDDTSVEDTSVEDTIEKSKVHWSQLAKNSESDKDKAEASNVEVFQSLQKHPTWGPFFRTFGDGGVRDCGELEVGEKFAEGGQAKLYHARVTWNDAQYNSYMEDHGVMFVLKVFRKGTFLQDLQKQWPQGIFRKYEEIVERSRCGQSQLTRYSCHIECGTLLRDGRFAFLLGRENEDLRTLIDHYTKARACVDCGPFSSKTILKIMGAIAKGMFELHNLDIIHRDLKASNVLCGLVYKKMEKYVYDYRVTSSQEGVIGDNYDFFVADFECSIGVVGTGFFRAPEILQALKDKVLNKSPSVFTKEADVYSYGMLCYEILTGKLPFEGHCSNNYDLVLEGGRPKVPHYVEEWACALLNRCWQSNPIVRPTFGEILELLDQVV